MCAVAAETGLVKTRLKKCFMFDSKKIQSLDFFSLFAHNELTRTPFCQYHSNKILT